MNNDPIPSRPEKQSSTLAQARTRTRASSAPIRLTAHEPELDSSLRQAEFFYLQKQIQAQTPMVIVLEDGELLEGCIELVRPQCPQTPQPPEDADLQIGYQVPAKLGDGGG